MNKINTHLRILVVDDDADDFFIINTYLEDIPDHTFDLIWAKNYTEGIEKIINEKPDICLLDFLLGNKTGINLLKEIRDKNCDVPIILLTGKGDVSIDREAMELGATDYLIKSELNSEKIERSLRYALSHTKALRDVRAHGQLYQTIFEKSKNMIYLIDSFSLNFITVNNIATEIFGYPKERFLNDLKFYDLFDDKNDADKIIEILRDENGSVTDFEVRMRTDKNSTRHCLLSAVNHETTDGQLQIHGTISDMTHLQQAEQDRMIAEKMAATSRFTRALAHEIRNPLTNIDLSVEQLESEYPDAEWLDCIHIIKRNSKRIGTLITELLHNSNPLILEFSNYKLHELLDETIAMAQDRINLKNINLQRKYAADNPSVLAASESFKIAILNIIVNAIEALPAENNRISITTTINKDACHIAVEDNGCGIPADQMTRIFEPYVTTKQRGTGLGLITTLNVIKAHKGSIRVHSTVDIGTRFLITLPIAN